MKRRFISGLLAGMMAVSLLAGLPEPVKVSAETVSGMENANFDFEDGLTGWDTTGTVTEETSGAQGGNKYVHLEAGASITTTIKDISQGSYTLSAWVKGTAGKNAKLTVSETGGPDSVALLDAYKNADAWTEMGHRNVLVYNGQMTITIEAGDKALDLDTMELVMDSADENTLSNWGFEEGESGWTTSGNVEAASGNDADTGDKALRLGADSEISQKISVEPNTRYSVTMRARVDKQDTFQTEKVKSTFMIREGAEFRELMLQVFRTRMAFRRSMQRTLRKNNAGITFEMLQVLSCLWHEQGISQQILAERIAKDKACLTNLMNNLEKKGYVHRKEDPADRRNKQVYLTPEGEEFKEQIRPILDQVYVYAEQVIGIESIELMLSELKGVYDVLENV